MLLAGVVGAGFESVRGNIIGPFLGGLIRGHLSPFITWAIVWGIGGPITAALEAL
jgi:hypothetical protein